MRKGRTLPLCAVVLLAACHGDSNQAPLSAAVPQAKFPAAVKRGPTPDELTTGMVEAATVGRSTVPVAMKFDLPQRPAVGEPLEVTIAVMPQIEADSATLTVAPSDGLKTSAGTAPIEMPLVDATQVYRHSISVTPTAEGVQLLGLSVALKHDDITETRVFSVPVIVPGAGDGASAKVDGPPAKH